MVDLTSETRFEHRLVVRLSGGGTSILMRLVSVLHSRGAEVLALSYSSTDDADISVTITLLMDRGRVQTLVLSLNRIPDVLKVELVEPRMKSA